MNTLENPNLDGDFKALIKAQEARKAERLAQRKKRATLSEVIVEDQNENSEAHVEAAVVQKNKEDPEILQLKAELSEAAQDDDAKKLDKALEKVSSKGLTLSHEAFREGETKANVLHKACEQKSRQVTASLIENQPYKFLMEDFGITVRNMPSRKTALHQLVEWGEEELIIKLLDKIPAGEDKLQFMMKTVITEVPGQRPRHLLAIHLAALHGHTYVVTFLVKLGIDVNATNNKNDSPILWACRGNHIETARQLMTLGADLQLQNDKGSSPLYFAVRYGFGDLVTVLIKEGKADVHQQRKLGLISPIVLASALGYTDIVRTLLDHGANINLKITGGFTPLHHAAVQGNVDTVELLLQRGAGIEDDNDTGDNALLLAGKENQIEVVELLAKHGASFTERNKQGMSIWDFAVEAADNELLIATVNSYRWSHAGSTAAGGKLLMPPGKTPLHSAALTGDCEKIRVLKSLGVDLAAEDEGGNTFFHLAARENQAEVLEEFIATVNVNAQNSEQETALHLAARNGHYEAIKILLNKIGVGVKNSSGETALHVACRSRRASPEVIGQMVDTIVKAHNWSLVDAEDRNGDTGLHVAARWGRSDIMEQLHPMNPRVANISGETPFHVAAKEGQLEVVETMLEIFGKDININQQNREGESVLHIAGERGDAAMVELLIRQGADLSLMDVDGNTVLHLLAIQCNVNPDNTIKYLQVFQAIVSNAVRWWCMRKDLMHPDTQSEVYEKYRRIALTRLTSQIPNNERLTVNMLAARRGAKDLMERILHIPKVYVFQKDKNFLFDVTDLTHETMAESNTSLLQKSLKEKKASRVSPQLERSKVTLSSGESAEKTSHSCLDLIVSSPNLMVANQMLDIMPIQQIVGDYWSAYQWMYGFIMIIHLVYMSLLSAYAVPLLRADSGDPEPWPYVAFLLWPFAILTVEFYYLIVSAVNICRKKDIQTKESMRIDGNLLYRLSDRLMQFVIANLSHITSVLFSSLVITWFILYLASTATNQAHVLAVAMILGWLYTIAFTEGFESVHAFTIMLKNIIIRDMTRFLFLYLLVMFAFALAFQCLLNLVPNLFDDAYPDAFSIYFVTFNMMIGMGEIFDDTLEQHPNATFIKILYLFYIILTTVILLNLLVAMMTDSYAAVKAREGTTWRVGSVRLAIELEKSMPFLPKIFKFIGIKHNPLHFDHESERWMMTIPKRSVIFNKEITRDNVIEAVSRLEKELKEMKVQYSDISDRLQVLMDKAHERPSSPRPGSARPRLRKSVAILQSKVSDQRPSVIRHGESDLLQFQKELSRSTKV